MTDPLAQRAAAADPDAWRKVTARYGALVAGIAIRFGMYGPDLEDVVQDTWAQLLRHGADVERAGPWLAQVAANAARSRLRDRSRYLPASGMLERVENAAPVLDGTDAVDARVDAGSLALTARRLVDRLPRQQRGALLACADGATERQIAAVLGCSRGAAKNHLWRARQQVREALENGEIPPGEGCPDDGTLLTGRQAAARAGVTPQTVASAADAGRLPVVLETLAGGRRYRAQDVDEWAKARTARSSPQAVAALNAAPAVLTTGQVAKVAGVARNTVARETDRGRIAAYRTPGGARRYGRDDVRAWLLLPPLQSGRPSREAA